MKLAYIFLLCAGLLFATVQAGIYPITPIAKTVWKGGQTATIKWIDDNADPSIADLPPTNILLMTGPNENQIVVTVIARNVQADAGVVTFRVPMQLGPPGPYYFLKFNSGTYSFWSTRFNITGISGDINGFDPNGTGNGTTSTTSTSTSYYTSSSIAANAATKSQGTSSTGTAKSTDATVTAASASSSPSITSGAVSVHPFSVISVTLAIFGLTISYLW